MKSLALTVTLCAALALCGCVTETEEDDTVVQNRIKTTRRAKVKKVKRPRLNEAPFDVDRPTTSTE